MPNLNPQDARTYDLAPTLWKYDPRTNILWLKLTDASSNTSWFPIHLNHPLVGEDDETLLVVVLPLPKFEHCLTYAQDIVQAPHLLFAPRSAPHLPRRSTSPSTPRSSNASSPTAAGTSESRA